MASLRTPSILAVLIVMLALVATSEAHTLEVSRAATATKTFAKLFCSAINEETPGACAASSPSTCQRLSQHRVRCGFFVTVNAEDGSRSRCLSLVEWSIRGESPRLYPHYLGVQSCTQLRPPATKIARLSSWAPLSFSPRSAGRSSRPARRPLRLGG